MSGRARFAGVVEVVPVDRVTRVGTTEPPVQPVFPSLCPGTRLPTTADLAPGWGAQEPSDYRGQLPRSGVQLADSDPLTGPELADLRNSESEIEEGRWTEIPPDWPDEELFRFLGSD